MKKLSLALIVLVLFVLSITCVDAQGPKGNAFGFGLILGEPSGVSIKYWTTNENAFDAYIGSSYFGRLRIGGDYLWHFDAFNSNIVKMYAGLGLAVGVGRGDGIFFRGDKNKWYYWEDDNSLGIAGRGMLGLSIVPRNTPLEIFLEVGPLMGLTPIYGINIDGAIGIRFYP